MDREMNDFLCFFLPLEIHLNRLVGGKFHLCSWAILSTKCIFTGCPPTMVIQSFQRRDGIYINCRMDLPYSNHLFSVIAILPKIEVARYLFAI